MNIVLIKTFIFFNTMIAPTVIRTRDLWFTRPTL